MDLSKTLNISSAGMDAQAMRLRVVAENLANQETTGSAPGIAPYQRQTVTFQNKLDSTLGVETVSVKQVGRDKTAFPKRFDPANPAADPQGYVQTPNVDSFVELMDMRDAQRTYDANLSVLQVTRGMLSRTIAMLK
jgi:flagellar basal-body rod protein FlgC